MDPQRFYGKKQHMGMRGRIVTLIPEESEDEHLSDDDEYRLPPRTVEDSDPDYDFTDEDENIEAIEALYLEEADDIDETEVQSTSGIQGNQNQSRTESGAKKNKTKLVWTEKSIDYDSQNVAFLGCENLPEELMLLETPMDFFKYLFPTEALNLMEEESNLYAEQIQPEKANTISRDDIRKFLGIIMYMSVVQLPSTRHYWKEGTYVEKVASSLTCNKFEETKRFLHFFDKTKELKAGDPNYDKLQKIRPLIAILRDRLRKIPKEEYLAVDEQMIPTKAKTSGMRQYNAKKPHKWGYLNYVLSGASGFSYDFDLFTGKHKTDLPDDSPDLGASGNVVTRLVETVPKHLNYKLFIDNWYTSLPLMAHLHSVGILPLGTIQLNRAKDISLPSTKELLKRGRGYCLEKCTDVNGVELSVTSWVDNKLVNMCSSYVGKDPMTSVKRYSKQDKKKIDVPRPKAIEIYNKYMGGVDLLDSMLGFYRIRIRSKKWYHRIFFHLIDLTCVNSWILWRRQRKQKNDQTYLPLLDFKLYIADVLMRESSQVFTPSTRKRGRPLSDVAIENVKKPKRRQLEMPPKEVAEDGVGHLPVWGNDRQRCKNCSLKTHIYCSKCVLLLSQQRPELFPEVSFKMISLKINFFRNCFF